MNNPLAYLSPRLRNVSRLRGLQKSGRVFLGPGTYGVPVVKTFDGDGTNLVIGNYCSIAAGATFVLGGNHPTDRISTFPFRQRLGLERVADGFPSSHGDIRIGHDVWIGTDAMILSGVSVGSGAVIAARSVVTQDVEPYAIVAGVPARLVRSRFSMQDIEALLDIAWWDWEEEKISAAVSILNDAIPTKAALDALRFIASK